eukprot:scaffold1441_cov120-Isochrysis_galbana.AAC.9
MSPATRTRAPSARRASRRRRWAYHPRSKMWRRGWRCRGRTDLTSQRRSRGGRQWTGRSPPQNTCEAGGDGGSGVWKGSQRHVQIRSSSRPPPLWPPPAAGPHRQSMTVHTRSRQTHHFPPHHC